LVLATLKEKGQVSIEFILIVAIALVYISAVVWPTVENSVQAAVDVKSVADTKLSAMKLANALDEATSSSGDMKKTISIFLPDSGTIWCSSTEKVIHYSTLVGYIGQWDASYDAARMNIVNPDTENCEVDPPLPLTERPDGFKCESEIELLEVLTDNCPSSMVGPLFRKVVVEKGDTGITIEWDA